MSVKTKKKPVVDVTSAPVDESTKVIAQESAQEPAQESNTAPTANVTAKKPVDKLIESGAKVRSNYTEEQKAIEGIFSQKVTRLFALTAQKIKERTVINGKESMEPQIVGYRFTSEVPIEGIEKEDGRTINVEANKPFDLTRMETGMFFSRPEMAGICANSRLTLRIRSNGQVFTPTLNDTTGVAVKSVSIVIDKASLVDGKNRYTCLPEFEETFGHLYRRRGRSGRTLSSGSSISSAERQKNLAAGFNMYLKRKNQATK